MKSSTQQRLGNVSVPLSSSHVSGMSVVSHGCDDEQQHNHGEVC